MNNQETIYNELGFFGALLKWIDEHPVLFNLILALECAAILWAVINYNFTTNF